MTARALISQIIVGDRRREDLGDIDGLAASIKRYGLLHPIVIDADNRLVAGERRLRAMQQIGAAWIDVRQLGELTDAELREIELEENLRRKDLTEYERSRTLVARVEAARQVAATEPELRAESARNSGPGRPSVRGSYRDVARRIETPVRTIRDAEQHIAAVERYPELEPLPQSTAIKAARELDAAPAESREEARERFRQEQATGERVLGVVMDLVPGSRERMEAAAMRTQFARHVESNAALVQLHVAPLVAALGADEVDAAHRLIRRTRPWLDELERELNKGIRLVSQAD